MWVRYKLHSGIVNDHFLELDTWIQFRNLRKNSIMDNGDLKKIKFDINADFLCVIIFIKNMGNFE